MQYTELGSFIWYPSGQSLQVVAMVMTPNSPLWSVACFPTVQLVQSDVPGWGDTEPGPQGRQIALVEAPATPFDDFPAGHLEQVPQLT